MLRESRLHRDDLWRSPVQKKNASMGAFLNLLRESRLHRDDLWRSPVQKKKRFVSVFSTCCGSRICTDDLQVMGLARYYFSIPRYIFPMLFCFLNASIATPLESPLSLFQTIARKQCTTEYLSLSSDFLLYYVLRSVAQCLECIQYNTYQWTYSRVRMYKT